MRRHGRGAWPYPFPPNCAFDLNRASPQAEGLVGWWPTLGSRGANVWRDYSGYGLDGALVGTPDWLSNDQLGSVLSYDGTNDYVDCGNVCGVGTSDFSILVRVQFTGGAGAANRSIIEKRDFEGANLHGYRIVHRATTSVIRAQISLNGAGTNVDSPLGYTSGVHTLAATYDRDGDCVLYIDGVSVNSGNIAARNGDINNDVPLLFGGVSPGSTILKFSGEMGEIGIWYRVLSPSLIYQMAHAKWDLYRPLRQPAAASVGFRRHMGMTGVGVEVG